MQRIDPEIRYTYSSDLLYLRSWLIDPRVADNFVASNAEEANSALGSWHFFTQIEASLTATFQHMPVAIATLFLMPYKKTKHGSLAKMVVNPAFWGKGIGTVLLKNLHHFAKEYWHLETISFEVFSGNKLENFLSKKGYQTLYKQEGFVCTEQGHKARLLMEKKL